MSDLPEHPRPWSILWVGNRVDVMDANRSTVHLTTAREISLWTFIVDTVNAAGPPVAPGLVP